MIQLGLGLGMSLVGGAEAGGSGFPSWLPTAPSGDRPLIYADFKNGNYWAGGAVRTSAIFVHNPDWGSWDPACITPGLGILTNAASTSGTVDPTYIASALGGCTVVAAVDVVEPLATAALFLDIQLVDTPGFVYDPIVRFSTLGELPDATSQGIASPPDESLTATTPFVANQAVVQIAGTFSTTETKISYLGSSVVTGTGADTGVTPNTLGFDMGQGANYFTTFVVYAPQPDANLPTLSTP